MLTIIKNPSDYNFSKSPMICEVETDNYMLIGNFGNKAYGTFYIPINPSVGNFIKLVSTALTIQLDFIAGTTQVTGKIREKVPADTMDDFYAKVLLDIQLNTSITSIFNVTCDLLGGFFFEAINPGPQYSLTASTTFGSSFNYFNNVVGTDDILNEPRPNYKIRCDIYIEEIATFPLNLTVFKNVFSAQKEPFGNKVKFDFSKIIDANLEYYFPTPNQSTSNLCSQTSKKFFIVIREFFGNPATENFPSINPTTGLVTGTNKTYYSFSLKAGLSPRWSRIQQNLQLDAYIFSYPLCLTNRPGSSFVIKKNQPEYIYFCLPNDVLTDDLKLKIITFNNDGTTSISYQSAYTNPCKKGATICFPVNPNTGVINNSISTNAPVNKFIVSIVSQSDVSTNISPEFTYYPNFEDLGDNKIFLFTNSLGGVDTFRSEGYFENEVEFEKEISSRIYFSDDDKHLGMYAQNQAYKQDSFKVFSGWKTQAEIDWLEDLFISKYVVEVVNFIEYVPIMITTKKIIRHKTNEFLKAIEFEFMYQYKSPVTDRLAASL